MLTADSFAQSIMSADDEYAISVAKTEYREGYNTANVDRLLSVFSDSLTTMPDGEPTFYGAEGRQALRLRAARLFRDYQVKMELTIVAITVLDGTAYDYGWEKMTLTPKAGTGQEIRRYRYSETWKKQKNGEWKIEFFISNKDSEPAMLEDDEKTGSVTRPNEIAP